MKELFLYNDLNSVFRLYLVQAWLETEYELFCFESDFILCGCPVE